MPAKLLPLKSVAVYLHIPFCVQKCRYCDFYSAANAAPPIISATISSTIDQLVYFYTLLGLPLVTSLYIGGGTPSSIGTSATVDLLGKVTEILHFSPDDPEKVEFTVEANPESLTSELLNIYRDVGVNRLSVGVQTFSNRHSGLIGRVGSPAHARNALELVAGEWKGKVSVDLLSALPEQTIEDGIADVNELLSYAPDHISLYTLTIEPGTPLYKDVGSGKIKMPGDAETAVWERQVRLLTETGYDRYEISNYALPGNRSRHNTSYWQMKPYLGCGPAAVSTLPSSSGPLRIENRRSLDQTGGQSYEVITPRAFFLEHIMMGLRLSEGIDRNRLKLIFDVDPVIPLQRTLLKWHSLVEIDADRLKMTDTGRNFLDGFLKDAAVEIFSQEFSRPQWP